MDGRATAGLLPGEGISNSRWERLGVVVGEELHAGEQSRVFEAVVDGRRVALKLSDASFVDRELLVARMDVVARVSRVLPSAVAPVPVEGRLVAAVDGWLVTATEFVHGRAPEVGDPYDAAAMGRCLAELHATLAGIEADLPPVAALRGAPPTPSLTSEWQLVHGDVSAQNLRIGPDGRLRVLDFDNCGRAPVSYDVANALYMVMFDVLARSADLAAVDRFRTAFVGAYVDASGRELADTTIDEVIALRVRAVRRWLDDLATAPIGIRTSSDEWLATLRRIIDTWPGTRGGPSSARLGRGRDDVVP